MNYESAKSFLLAQRDAVADYPFGPDPLAAKVEGKIFGLLWDRNGTGNLNLKCDPQEALALRDIFPSVLPGYHMNKRHWNTVVLDGSIPDGEIERMIENSWALVVNSLTRRQRQSLLGR
ncbi:MAG: MmcQ/YjbR family DNA-binding protein [Pseudohongiellaceae bacterium]